MSDPFNILGDEFDLPPSFDAAVREKVAQLQESADRFQELYSQLAFDDFREEEWKIVERTAADLEESVEKAEDGFVAVQYDSHAWYRIMESLQRIVLRLDSAIHLMQEVRERAGKQDGSSPFPAA